ncbi:MULTISPECIES: hypothetical protein [Pseudoalteromonas]|uniref:hypothetical protein n=1 Tax=Pseudoalteromonas TaxID=53246 RepID=UPI00057B696C|nr:MULTISPECIES: hypothetical protein [Pseudoalteromonas]ATG58214.1 hypothetical protein CPA52_08145 [Pseudoalteromonas marina]
MASDQLKEYRRNLDKNLGLVSKRKILATLSILLLAIQFTGAVFKEANTFIFKIEFTNQNGLSIFLFISVLYMLIRYYSYAHEFHEELFNLRAERMLKDPKIFRYMHGQEKVTGLLGKAISLSGEDNPGIRDAKYYTDGLYRRKIVFLNEYYDHDGPVMLEETISLNKFNNEWKIKDLIRLHCFEMKFMIESLTKYREELDLLGPYVLSTSALILTFLKLKTSDYLQLWKAMTS